jgi:hypothetical protein
MTILPFDSLQHIRGDLGVSVVALDPLSEDLVPLVEPLHHHNLHHMIPLARLSMPVGIAHDHHASLLLDIRRHGRPVRGRLHLAVHPVGEPSLPTME